jgi:chromosome segregation ATPase
MSNSPNDDERLDIERTDELPVLLETVVLDAGDPRLSTTDTLEDTSEHTARYQAFAAVEAAELDELKNDLAARGAKIAALEADIARLAARWGDVEKHISAKDAEITTLKRVVADGNAALVARGEAEKKVTAELATRDADIARLRGELATRDAGVAQLRDDLATREADIARLSDELATRDADVVRLRDELATRGADVVRLRDELAARDANVVRLRAELATRDADGIRLRDELAALRNAVAAQPDIPALERELGSARDIAAGLRSELKTALAQSTEMPSLRERIATLEADIAARRSAASELETRANALAARAAALEDQNRIAAEAQKRAENVATTEIGRAKALRAELIKQTRRVESLQRDLTARRGAEAEPQHTTLALRAELVSAQETAAHAAAKVTATRAAHAVAIEAIEQRHAKERAELEAEVAAAKREAIDAHSATPALPAFEVIAQLEAEVEFKRQQVNAQLVALRERDQRLAEVEQTLERERAETTATRLEFERLRADTARLERALIDRDRTIEAKETRIAALQDEINQKLGAVQKLNAMDLSLQGLDSRMSERLRQNDKMPVDNLNTPALVCLTGDAPKQFALVKATVVIGRGEHCDVQVLTHFVSREHARINVMRGNATIEDLGSTNGVFVNSIRVDRHELRQGDLITVGETQFRFLESMAH